MQYNFNNIEKKWQTYWEINKTNQVKIDKTKTKFYILDMFPYPSGAGLHVGHPLGYIASDIYSRYQRLKGYNVLHPMGYDAFGLPAEQYAIDHQIHPATATDNNIETFRHQLKKIGLCFDWSRELKTSDPKFYKWTQWIFIQLFESFYNRQLNKAESISILEKIFDKEGNQQHPAPAKENLKFSAEEWQQFTLQQRSDVLMEYRLMYVGVGEVNWCDELGTVLANDEIENGFSKRGNFPVIRRKFKQWNLRITEYAERLLEGLTSIEFTTAMQEMQTHWIGKSLGANIQFFIKDHQETLTVFTTRPDTIFGVDFMVIAPEHPLISLITTATQKENVNQYLKYCQSKTDVERQKEKKITGCFTGSFCYHPFTAKFLPIWISEYVLIGYGTGAIMAVPCGDERDFNFARHFNLPITNIIGDLFDGTKANPTKEAILCSSDWANGLSMKEASIRIVQKLVEAGTGVAKINYKLRDAAFSRQRYWGEPIPIRWENGLPKSLDLKDLPLLLPNTQTYELDKNGDGVLAQFPDWVKAGYETLTMPGAAGSSWYFLRYMDNDNDNEFVAKECINYWQQVDIYIGGTEHATGHLIYSRMWTKFLFDLGYLPFDEPYKKLINQGMIQAFSWFCYVDEQNKLIVSQQSVKNYTPENLTRIRIPFADKYFITAGRLDNHGQISQERKTEFLTAIQKINYQFLGLDLYDKDFDLSIGFTFEYQIEKMSKSKYNVVTPDEIIAAYGADTFRLYEMFLGPIEQSKPWDTKGIEGVHRFIKKVWRLFYDDQDNYLVTADEPQEIELKILHKTIKKVSEDIEKFSFNTAISTLMVCVNELHNLRSYKQKILENLVLILAPIIPHLAEELWEILGQSSSVTLQRLPEANPQYLVEHSKEYPISINGKLRTLININLEASEEEIKKIVLNNEVVLKWTQNLSIKKVIIVKNKMVNIVI